MANKKKSSIEFDKNSYESNEGDYQKPGFDGRLKYYDHLANWMTIIGNSQYNEDYHGWFRALRGYFSVCQPFVRKNQKEEIKEKFKTVKETLGDYSNLGRNNNHPMVRNELYDELIQLTDEIYDVTRELLLPVKGGEDEEMDFDDFLRGSDL